MSFFASDLEKFLPELRASLARGSTLITLSGPLGAGKTTFTRELFAALGARDASVQSPTFLKLIEHEIPPWGQCLHLDAYRMENADDLRTLSLESYLEARLWIVEWPQLFLEFLRTHETLRRALGLREYFDVKISGEMTAEAPRALTVARQSF